MVIPTVISTFAGCGGSSLGYRMAGFQELLAVEWDQNAVDTFRLNFPEVPVYHGDIAALSVGECLHLAGDIKPGELDVLDGSPPCQGFSTAGKRKYDDPRNSLFKEYVRLLDGLRPRVFVMENVTGMIKGHMKQAYLQIVASLRGCGYVVSGEVMNAMYYGVPQSRERVILIGVREDLGINPSHPKPQTRPMTLKDACPNIGHLVLGPHGTYQGRIINASKESSPTICKTGLPSFVHRVIEVGKAPPRPSELKMARWAVTKKGANHPERFSLHRLGWKVVTPTIQKTATGSTGLMHPDEPRELTELELKRIGSFPDEYKFVGTWKNVLARIGNSVPPLLMKAIAEHIRREILEKIA